MEGFVVDLLREFPSDYSPQLQVVPCDCDECRELAVDFTGHKWTAIADTTIDRHAMSLPLFTPEGLRYFIPAFLRAALARPESDIMEFLMYSLGPSGVQISELSQFTDSQRGVIVKFLNLMADAGACSRDKLWTKTCKRWQPV